MRIKTTETFEQKYKNPNQINQRFGSVEYIKFQKNAVYQFFIIPKVLTIDLEADEAEVDYPFEEIITHFGVYNFVRDHTSYTPERINCKGCEIEDWMSESRVPKEIFKIIVGTKFYLAYVINEKKIKLAWFQDYLYSSYIEQIAKLMNDKNISLLDALRHRVKLFTNQNQKFAVEISQDVSIPVESQGFKNVLKAVNEKPLETLVEQEIITDYKTISQAVEALKSYSTEVEDEEKKRKKRSKMEEKTKQIANTIDAFNTPPEENHTNGVITDDMPMSVGPMSLDDDQVEQAEPDNPEDPF